jgi:hypothetical protein
LIVATQVEREHSAGGEGVQSGHHRRRFRSIRTVGPMNEREGGCSARALVQSPAQLGLSQGQRP